MAILMAVILDVICAVGESAYYVVVFITGTFSYSVAIAAYNQVFNSISQKEDL